MAHPNELAFLAKFLKDYPSNSWIASLDGQRVLQCGAAPITTPGVKQLDYTTLFPERTIVSVDQTPGDGVDIVCDLTGECLQLKAERFAAVLCCSVLEHCERPWMMASHLESHLSPQGMIYVTVPWIWRRHDYPQDYWRMSEAGIRILFPSIVWKRVGYFSQALNEQIPEQDASKTPWRQAGKGGRVFLCSQMLCMIGRKS